MDFVSKKAFEAQVTKFGKDLGLGSSTKGFGSSGAQERQSEWSIFPSRSEPHVEEQRVEAEEVFATPEAAYFDTMPRNYPPFLHLFFLDRTILSDAAQRPVSYAHMLYLLLVLGLCMNTVSAILVTAIIKVSDWPFILASVITTALLGAFEMYAYQTAFRGAYKTSTKLRLRYVVIGAVNLGVISLYAFVGVLFFNGWSRLRDIDDEHANIRRALTIIESLYWTLMLFFNTFTMFEFYHFQRDSVEGLSNSARGIARRAMDTDAPSGPGPGESSRPHRSDRARIDEIRDRYRTADI